MVQNEFQTAHSSSTFALTFDFALKVEEFSFSVRPFSHQIREKIHFEVQVQQETQFEDDKSSRNLNQIFSLTSEFDERRNSSCFIVGQC